MDKLEAEIKQLIIDALNLEDIEPSDIESEERLFVEGLGLDSIDALELGVAIEEKFAVSIDPKDEKISEHFYSVRNLAKYVADRLEGK
jgi:acyl carrier protein